MCEPFTPGFSEVVAHGEHAPAVTNPGSRGYEPAVPITTSPILDWPPRPLAVLGYLVKPVMLPYGVCWVALAALCWHYLTPSMERMAALVGGCC